MIARLFQPVIGLIPVEPAPHRPFGQMRTVV
jgi:hypothetical protein